MACSFVLAAMSAKQQTVQRKREACRYLRDLAAEVGYEFEFASHAVLDLKISEFNDAVHGIRLKCNPEQQGRLELAIGKYNGVAEMSEAAPKAAAKSKAQPAAKAKTQPKPPGKRSRSAPSSPGQRSRSRGPTRNPDEAPQGEQAEPPTHSAGPVFGPQPDESFRLRSTTALFTWNSLQIVQATFAQFVLWLMSLDFVFRWTAKLEKHL